MEKRKATLADVFAAKKFSDKDRLGIKQDVIAKIQSSVRQAHKFIFDDDATKRVADVIVNMPELIIRESGLARAPFPRTWIEFNHSTLHSVLRRYDERTTTKEYPENSWQTGVLIEDDQVIIIAGGTIANKDFSNCWVTPFVYELHEPLNPIIKRLVGHIIAGIYWGSTYYNMTKEEIDRLTNSFNMRPLLDAKFWPKIATEFYGDLRTVIAFLLMLNRPAITSYVNTLPSSRGWQKNRQIPYSAHTVVTIKLDPKPILRMLGTAGESGIVKRRHEVRGHYAHNETARDYGSIGCLHDWQPLSDRQWQCQVCAGKRWWVVEHERGDVSLGYVKHDAYEVKP